MYTISEVKKLKKKFLLDEKKKLQRKQIKLLLDKKQLYYSDNCKLVLYTTEARSVNEFLKYMIEVYIKNERKIKKILYYDLVKNINLNEKTVSRVNMMLNSIFFKIISINKGKKKFRWIIPNETFEMFVKELDRRKKLKEENETTGD